MNHIFFNFGFGKILPNDVESNAIHNSLFSPFGELVMLNNENPKIKKIQKICAKKLINRRLSIPSSPVDKLPPPTENLDSGNGDGVGIGPRDKLLLPTENPISGNGGTGIGLVVDEDVSSVIAASSCSSSAPTPHTAFYTNSRTHELNFAG